MRHWLIPMFYVGGSVVAGIALPRLEHVLSIPHSFDVSAASAQAYLSAAASGMMALTGIVFAMAFFMVQFGAIAYSPRFALWLARDNALFHALGIFSATFIFSLSALLWVDRGGSGKVPVFSGLLVAIMLICSMVLFARLVQRLNDLQISSVLRLIGDRGREVIAEMFAQAGDVTMPARADNARPDEPAERESATQIIRYFGRPRSIARFDIKALVALAAKHDALLVSACAVGDTLLEGSVVFHVYRAQSIIPDAEILRAVRLGDERTFEQDPKYPMRLLVDIAIKALSPAINDPTTAVQAIDQIEDLLRRLGRRDLDAGRITGLDGVDRLIVPMPTWEDYLILAFDEIRQFGGSSIQVMRRMRTALAELARSTDIGPARAEVARQFLKHLDESIERSPFDAEDREIALQEDPQGLGLTRQKTHGHEPCSPS